MHPRGPPHPSWLRHATFSPAGRRLWPFRWERSNVDGVPLIRHGLTPMPPSPRGRLFVSYPRGRCRGGYDPPGIPPVGPPYPFCPFGTFPLDKGNRPRNDRFFDRLGSPCGGAGTASAVTERAASLVKGRWHGEAVTEGFRPPESYPKNGIPQSASLTAPFNKGAKGREIRIPTSLRSSE